MALAIVAVGVLSWPAIFFGNSIALAFESDVPSRSVGSVNSGSLLHGKRLPTTGDNYRAYSRLGATLGRNSVHGAVREVVLDAYARMSALGFDHQFVYGETGWPSGGSFRPHRTHQNGLSVDFMVPVLNEEGESVPFPTSVLTRFGYDLEFDEQGRHRDLRIDFAALAAHLMALEEAATEHGLSIERIVLTPEYRSLLLDAETGASLQEHLPFMPGKSWARHDEHYHVDFALSGE